MINILIMSLQNKELAFILVSQIKKTKLAIII